jgi:hypothetical protein
MAKFIPSSTIDLIAGSIGKDTYSRVKSGGVIKAKSRPGSVHPYTISPAQKAINDQFAAWSPAWQSLTDAQRLDWGRLAANKPVKDSLGKSYYQSGFNLFVSCNNNLALIGVSPLTDVPILSALSQIQSFNITIDSHHLNQFDILYSGSATSAGCVHLVYASPLLSPGLNYCRNKYRLISQIPVSTSSPFDITSAYTALFGALKLSMKVFIKLIPINQVSGFAGISVFNSIIL